MIKGEFNILMNHVDEKQSIYRDTWVPSVVLTSSLGMIFIYVVHQYIKLYLNRTLVPLTLILITWSHAL
jgi:uncharacterized UPF0160 family protein